ncbi:MAG: ABC-F family ATP-binding cassette domain-containing protein [bacterium]
MLISCHELTKTYWDTPLFTGVSLTVSEEDRIGVIGPNGSGKSTLLKILAGIEEPDEGERVQRKLLRVAYVDQGPVFDPDQTVLGVLLDELDRAPPDPTAEETDHRVRASIVLSKLGFVDLEQRVGTLSGGWQKRLAIGRAVVLSPDVLLLDEPTNHLDLEGILWLEGFLVSQRFAYVVVSHDRAFLQQVAARMLELDRRHPGGVLAIDGRYTDLVEKRQAALEARAQHEAAVATKVRRELEWLRRGPKARTTKAKGRIDEARALISELDQLKAQNLGGTATIDFSASGRKTKRLLVATGLGKSLGDRRLFGELDLLLRPKLRLGLVGPNGSGKTTLLRVLADELPFDEGNLRRVDNLQTVYFDQRREQLDQELTLRRALSESGDTVLYRGRPIHVAGWAQRFLFRTEQLDTPLHRLSGGEQAKVLIARLMLRPADLLLLDEPTNDLDIPTLEVLEESLTDFPGAVVMVTHDRFLLDRVSTLLLGLDGTGGATLYADYAQWAQAWEAQRQTERDRHRDSPRKPPRPRRGKKPLTYGEELELAGLEDRIAKAESLLTDAQRHLEDPDIAADAGKLTAAYTSVQSAQEQVDALYARWTELESRLDGDPV